MAPVVTGLWGSSDPRQEPGLVPALLALLTLPHPRDAQRDTRSGFQTRLRDPGQKTPLVPRTTAAGTSRGAGARDYRLARGEGSEQWERAGSAG